MKAEELIKDDQLDKAFGNANFGNITKREVVLEALIKCLGSYRTGHTATQIVRELGLVNINKWELTSLGRKYLCEAMLDQIGYGVDQISKEDKNKCGQLKDEEQLAWDWWRGLGNEKRGIIASANYGVSLVELYRKHKPEECCGRCDGVNDICIVDQREEQKLAEENKTWWNKVWDACKEAGMTDQEGWSSLDHVLHFIKHQKRKDDNTNEIMRSVSDKFSGFDAPKFSAGELDEVGMCPLPQTSDKFISAYELRQLLNEWNRDDLSLTKFAQILNERAAAKYMHTKRNDPVQVFRESFLKQLRRLSVDRAKNGFKTYDNQPITYWTTAIMGEFGELCNMIKKMKRAENGGHDSGHSYTAKDITPKMLREEMGGTLIYLDLLASVLDIDLEFAIAETFNEKSKELKFPQFLTIIE